MNSPRDLRRRIKSITSTAQLTKAMQMVAASKMRKAQDAATHVRPFGRLLYEIQREATTRMGDFKHPLLEGREVHKRAVILVGADKGLCGPLNSNVLRIATKFDIGTTLFITAGRRAAQFIARTHRQLAAEFSYGDSPTYAEARAIARFARDLFLNKEVDQVQVVATQFVNTLTQVAVCLEFLPIGEITGLALPATKPPGPASPDAIEFVFEPSPEFVMGYLLSHYLNAYIYEVLVHAKASEQSARMVSMKNATDNADGLIKHLTLEYNKLRQGNITKEMLEIAGGKSA
jgi:F-type H+-transporting ATPase subunit gamma